MKGIIFTLAITSTLTLSRLAVACPMCAGRDHGDTVGTVLTFAGMLTLPFALTYGAYRVIQRFNNSPTTRPSRQSGIEQ